MRLERLSVAGFQSFRDEQTVELDARVTLLAGRNDVGKSALLRALRLGAEPHPGGSSRVTIGYSWRMGASELAEQLRRIDAQGSRDSGLPALREALDRRGGEVTLRASFEGDTSAGEMTLANLPLVSISIPALSAEFSVGRWTSGPVSGQSAGFASLQALLREGATRINYVLPRRPLLGMQQLVYSSALARDASNLTSVVHRLHAEERNGSFAALEDLLIQAFPSIRAIGFRLHANEGAPAAAELHIAYSDARTIALSQCGTGIEQLIALGTAVLTQSEPRLILIDEPSSFLHPAAERVLIDFLNAHPEHRYVIATHSPVFLNAYPLSQARLLSMDASHTTKVIVPSVGEVLEEVGLRAGDLWLHPRQVWVEGESEIAAANAMIAEGALDRETVGTLQALPSLGRLLSKPEAQFEMVNAIAKAVSDITTEQWFVLDRDEKKPADISRIERAGGGRVVFLEVRELENCFLCAPAIGERLRSLKGGTEPTDEAVEARLGALLEKTDERRLYPAGPPEGNMPDGAKVKGSEVLSILYEELALAGYDKAKEAGVLASAVLRHAPELLRPFLNALPSPQAAAKPFAEWSEDDALRELARLVQDLPQVDADETWRRLQELSVEQRRIVEDNLRAILRPAPPD